jgi:hypothetical protein
MRIKLDGWQRIGILLSVLAVVGLAAYAWVFQARQRDHFYSMQLSLCNATIETEKGLLQYLGKEEVRAQRAAEFEAEYVGCKNEAGELLARSFNASLRHMPIFLAKVLAIIVFAWLIEWFVVEIVGWIKRSSRTARRTRV